MLVKKCTKHKPKLSKVVHNQDRILIKMVKVQGKYIRLGIEAPKEIQIDRGAQDGDHVCRCMHCGEKY